MTPKERDHTFTKLIEAWQAEDFSRCKEILIVFCENMDFQELVGIFCSNFNAARAICDLFFATGLSRAAKGTPIRKAFLSVAGYILKNRTPELDAAMKKAREFDRSKLQPVGYDKNRKPVYDVDDLAAPHGLTGEQLLSDVQEILDMGGFCTPEGVTVH